VPDARRIQLPPDFERVTEAVIGASIAVYQSLGEGLLERIYERALQIELQHRGVEFRSQVPASLRYRDVVIGEFALDLLVEDRVVVELKCAEAIADAHIKQVANYLLATNKKVGLVLNFHGERVGIRRVLNGTF